VLASLADVQNGTATHALAEEPPELFTLEQLVDPLAKAAQRGRDAAEKGEPRGFITGFPSLDSALGGCLEPGVHELHSNTGTGKTAFAWQIATQSRNPCLYVSCEIRPVVMMRRLVARITDTPVRKLVGGSKRDGGLDGSQVRKLAEDAITRVPNASKLAIVDAKRQYASPEYLHARVQALKGADPYFLLVIDSVHAWIRSTPVNAVSEYELITAGLTRLEQLAAELDIPVLLINERSRNGMEKGTVNASAGSRQFEYMAETVLSLEPPKPGDRPRSTKIDLKIQKNRNGGTPPPLKFEFLPDVMRFEEVP
jgi:replicative DNA helicase